jgi:transcriptional regulator with XRE-family HTH domain
VYHTKKEERGNTMADEMKRIFSLNLQRIMSEKYKTQTEIANMLQLNKSTVHSWYIGRSLPTSKKMKALSEVLRVPVAELVENVSEQDERIRILQRIASAAVDLNDEGIRKLEERVHELTEIERYRKSEEV